jgi:hypothetical protein
VFLARYLRHLKKHAAIGGYRRKLPKLLAAAYGRSKSYTPAQVKRTIERAGLNSDYSCYGMAMFCRETDFNTYHQTAGETCDFAAMRGEIAAVHFQGNADFTAADVAPHGAGADGGGHAHSGDGGGGGHH